MLQVAGLDLKSTEAKGRTETSDLIFIYIYIYIWE